MVMDYNNNPDLTLKNIGDKYNITPAGVSYHLTKTLIHKRNSFKPEKKLINEKHCTKKDCAYCNRISGGNKEILFKSLGVKYKEEELITITLKSKI